MVENMEVLYAKLGRKQEAVENLQVEYGRLLSTLADVVAGRTAVSRVTIDTATLSWAVAPQPAEAVVETAEMAERIPGEDDPTPLATADDDNEIIS
jgi:hypothetical protein